MKKIKNVEKFREELYEAIEEGFCYNYCDHRMSATIRQGHVDWVQKAGGVKDKNLYRAFGNGTYENYEVVALAYPIHFVGTSIYMTVSEDGVDFWESNKVKEENGDTFFVHKSWVDYSFYETKLGFIVAVINTISECVEDAKRNMEA